MLSPFFGSMYCVVRDEPHIAAAASDRASLSSVTWIVIGNAHRQSFQRNFAGFGEMENELPRSIQESFPADWVEMAVGVTFDVDGLHPDDFGFEAEIFFQPLPPHAWEFHGFRAAWPITRNSEPSGVSTRSISSKTSPIQERYSPSSLVIVGAIFDSLIKWGAGGDNRN